MKLTEEDRRLMRGDVIVMEDMAKILDKCLFMHKRQPEDLQYHAKKAIRVLVNYL